MKSVKQGKSQGAVPAFRSYDRMRICTLHRIDVLTVNCSSLGQVLNHHVLGLSLLREALVSLPQDCHKDTARCDSGAPARRKGIAAP
jgi:hypothetical protein